MDRWGTETVQVARRAPCGNTSSNRTSCDVRSVIVVVNRCQRDRQRTVRDSRQRRTHLDRHRPVTVALDPVAGDLQPQAARSRDHSPRLRQYHVAARPGPRQRCRRQQQSPAPHRTHAPTARRTTRSLPSDAWMNTTGLHAALELTVRWPTHHEAHRLPIHPRRSAATPGAATCPWRMATQASSADARSERLDSAQRPD